MAPGGGGMNDDHVNRAEGVGGRLAKPKSASYRRALSAVEARALPYVARLMLATDLAYVLAAAELGLNRSARPLVGCLLELLGECDELVRARGGLDVVVQREIWVAERVGADAAAWLHFGRNRGESLRGFLPRMFFRDALYRGRIALLDFLDALLARAEETIEAPAPVYHHLQHAGITTLGEWLLSYAGNIAPHIERFEQTLERLDVTPPVMSGRPVLVALGEGVRRRLGFSRVAQLRQQMHTTEDQFAEPLFVLVALNVALSRLAEDLRLYSTEEFAFFEIADEHASGSSGLPQKKNPFGLQAVIGGASMGVGRLTAQLAANVSVSEELDTVFHAASAYQYADDAVAWTVFIAEVIALGRFDLERLRQKAGSGFAGASEALDILVVEGGMPFRDAHHMLGGAVRARHSNANDEAFAELRQRVPEIDFDHLERVLTGEELSEYCLNINASRTALAELRETMAAARARTPAESPVEEVIEALEDEARVYLRTPAG